ncbi:hypothetical protein CRENBAI_016995 [Crenichthys baileyi]|uniref:Uncharacterized protein n=1 Tax=Crenichthys baileyi TaxID=28760 RepID=A0AAV9QY60_9TELE
MSLQDQITSQSLSAFRTNKPGPGIHSGGDVWIFRKVPGAVQSVLQVTSGAAWSERLAPFQLCGFISL